MNAATINAADYMTIALNVVKYARVPHAIKDQADGIALEALVLACQKYDGNRSDAMAPKGYIVAKVRQALIDATRAHFGRGKEENKVSVVSLSSLTHTDDDGGTCEYNVADGAANDPEAKLTLDHILSKVEGMSEKVRLCVTMKAQGYKGKEIASKVGLTEGRVSQILKDAYKKLQKAA